MSANNWDTCPSCLKREIEAREKAIEAAVLNDPERAWPIKALQLQAEVTDLLSLLDAASFGANVVNNRIAELEAERDRLKEVFLNAANYVRCSKRGLSPYIRENSLSGEMSPWAELCESVEKIQAEHAAHQRPERKRT